MNKHTSLELSKKLYESGCKIESEMYWVGIADDKMFLSKETRDFRGFPDPSEDPYQFIFNAQDLLWDICIKHAKEFFVDNDFKCQELVSSDYFLHIPAYQNCAGKVLFLLQENKTQEAENYIWEHCKFNPKNK